MKSILYFIAALTLFTHSAMAGPPFPELVDPNPNPGNNFGATVLALRTGNVVVTSPNDDAGGTDAGAVYLFNGATGILISTLTGSSIANNVSSGGVVELSNGNYVILSPAWDNGTVINAGAATWGSGTAGISGVVNSINSLVGSSDYAGVGSGVTSLTNGNYVVHGGGAITWGNGTVGSKGIVDTSNALFGIATGHSVSVLSNGNYVVVNPNWSDGTKTNAGSVTWGNGASGTVGIVGEGNSFVGTSSYARVGSRGLTQLTNGNYVVSSPSWTNGSVSSAGAVCLFNSVTGAMISMLTGSVISSNVGSGGVKSLSNGNFVVLSPSWNSGSINYHGAVTWCNGTTGINGTVSAANSLVGSQSVDEVGNGGVTELSNGNYVVCSYNFGNYSGAVTWSSGISGITGAVSAANSLVGSPNNRVGVGGVTALSNGNYVVRSYLWDNLAATDAGAVTWCNGLTGTTGFVSASNSLVGNNTNDNVGSLEVRSLSNGNYLVISPSWSNANVGAVTWGNGATGITGVVSSSNSLVGSSVDDRVGSGSVRSLNNGNYVVVSPYWKNGTNSNAGAITWGNGAAGITGLVSGSNSLVGSSLDDSVGSGSVTALSNGNYVTSSPFWRNGTNTNAGAVTWGNGTTGITGVVSSTNSLVGSSIDDRVGSSGVVSLSNGNYVVICTDWDYGVKANAGAVAWGNGSTGTSGALDDLNSLLGASSNAVLQPTNVGDDVNDTFFARFLADGGGRVRLGSQLDGLARSDAEMNVEHAAETIADSGTKSFGAANNGSTADLTFTIRNIGSADLILNGVPKAAISGLNAAMFTVTTQPSSPIVPGGETTFTVRFSPNSSGLKTAVLSIINNDTNENPFNITLAGTGVNVEPSISDIANQSTNEDTVTGEIAFMVGDLETAADSLAVSYSSSNTGLVSNSGIVFGGGGANRTMTITPAADQFGTATITITVSDSVTTVSDTFLMTVNAVNDMPSISDIANRSTNEDTATGAIAFTVGDLETASGSLSVSGSSSNSGLVPNSSIVFGGSGASRTVNVTPAANQFGTATITITVSDSVATVSDTFLLTVNAVNDMPSISDIANRSTNEDTATGAIAFTVGDSETTPGSLSVSGNSSNTGLVPNSSIVFGGSGVSRVVNITPAANQFGTTTITITVNDGLLTKSDSFVLTVIAVNDLPSISDIANRSTNEDTASGVITFTVGDLETPATSLTLTGSSNNTGLVPDGSIVFGGSGTNRTFSVTPNANMNGVVAITITVSDGSANAVDSFLLTINAINDAPTISDIPNQSAVENVIVNGLLFVVGDLETDLAAQTLTGSSSNTDLVPNASIAFGVSEDNRTISLTPAPNQKGTTIITVTVSDGELSASDSFILTVNAPEIVVEQPNGMGLQDGIAETSFGNVVVPASSLPVTYTVRNTGTSSLSGLILTKDGSHSADFLLSGLGATTLAPGASTTLTVTFKPTASGERSAELHIGSNDTDENPFDIALIGIGQEPPVFTAQPQSQLVLLGQSANFSPTVTGDPVITYKWKKGTSFITNATASSYGIVTTKAADTGAYSVIADNPVGAEVPSSTAYLGLVTLSQGTQVLKAGTTLILNCTVAAPTAPGVTLSYSWRRNGDPLNNETQADGSVVTGADKAALRITKLTTADAGIYTCLVTLNTPGNDPSVANGETVVRVVDAVPDVDALPPRSVSVSEPIDMTITATNFPTSFSAAVLPAGLKFDAKTGRLTGKPTTPSKKNTLGAYIPSKLSFKATNPFGSSVAEDFYLTIEPLVSGVVGTFNGIVARSGHTNFGMGGHVRITVASSGVVSGDVTLAGQKHSVVGSLNVSLGNNPTFDLIVKRRPASLGDLRLSGGISPPDDLLSGDIFDPRFEMLTGEQALGVRNEPGLINGTMEEARFSSPSGLALLANGSGYISDLGNHTIRFVDGGGGTVSTFAGNTNSGSNDGTGTAASFAGPEGLALDIAGNLFVADTLNATIRKITPSGIVTTFAGTAGQVGNVNGTGTAARFNLPCALCFDPTGNLYVADRGNHTIRKITSAGVVTTLAGKAGQSGYKDGSGTSALFNIPRGIVYDPVLKALFVTDSANVVIRKITLAGATTTYAGSAGAGGIADGLFANARFIDPRGITTLGDGTLIVTDTLLVQLNSNGTLGTVSDFLDTVGKLDHPVAVAYTPADKSLITVDDVLHGAISYEPSGLNQEAHFDAQRNPWTTSNFLPPAQQGIYNAALETTALSTNASFPHGDGYAQVTISKSGAAAWTGKAADGTSFTFSTFIAGDRSIPLHAMFHKNTGSLQGETFINSTTFDIIGDNTPALDWYKLIQPQASTDRSYKGGFPVHDLTLTGGKYVPNDLHLYLGFPSAPSTASLRLSFTESLINPFIQTFTLTKPNTLIVPSNAKSLTMKIDPKTGIFAGSFKEGSPAVTVPFAGILIDYEAGTDKSGHGHYLIPESASATSRIQSYPVRLEAD